MDNLTLSPLVDRESRLIGPHVDVTADVQAGTLGVLRCRMKIVLGAAVGPDDVHSLIGGMLGEKAAILVADEFGAGAQEAIAVFRSTWAGPGTPLLVVLAPEHLGLSRTGQPEKSRPA